MLFHILLTVLILLAILVIAYKIANKLFGTAPKSKTREEVDAEIKMLQEKREELVLKEQSVEVLKEIKNIDKQLAKVNKTREKLV